jgi:hypothetical protein
MAGGQRGYEKVLRIVGVGVAAKDRVRTAGEIRLALDLETVLSPVTGIGRRAVAEVAVPDEMGFIVVGVLPTARCGHEWLLL